jgi:eukaryotic-like serine/threonine-protein kinase
VSPERWQQIERLYDAVIQHQPGERAALLEQWCAGDDELRREVEWMLAHQQEAAHFIQVPALEAAARSLASDSDESPAESASEARATNRGRPRWWMYVIAIAFLAHHAFWLYLGPFDLDGMDVVFESGMRIRDLRTGSQLEQVGLQTGDLVLSVGAVPVRNVSEWGAAQANMRTGMTQRWTLVRGQEHIDLDVVLRRDRRGWTHLSYAVLYFGLVSLGLFIGFQRPQDPVARIGALLFMTMSIIFGLQNGWATAWREVLPAPVQGLLWIPEFARFAIDGIFLSFFVTFPRRIFSTRWLWFAIWAPVLATLPWRVWGFYSVIYRPGQSAGIPGWVRDFTGIRTTIYLIATVMVLMISYRRLADLNERRRVRVLVVGTTIGLMAAIPTVWIYSFWGYGLGFSLLLWATIFIPLSLVCPAAFAYAILRHRILDIQIIIRQGLQYALARRAILGVVPAVGAILISDLVINSAQPLASILRARGWAYGGLSGLVIVTYRKRKQWLDALDRRFFRERYDAQRTLRDVAAEIGQSRSVERAAPRVVARIKTALHPEFISMMVRERDGPNYHSLSSVPSGHVLPAIRANSKLIILMTVLGKPLEVSPIHSAWLARRLPEEEIEFVRSARLDLLVPITTANGRMQALLALGIKQSEEPYTREDQELLESIACSLALLFEQPAPAAEAAAQIFQECPQCGICYETSSETCPLEGAALVTVNLPRTLVGRYRLERRGGHGGMGTVYEATDAALERRVAVKVISDNLIGNPEAARRFRRESRAAAGFSHPNVVTVYDYGVEADARAFLVMELLKGVTLRAELDLRKRLDPSRMIEIFHGVCAATEAAHRRHLIHRDLKPDNIFLSQSEDRAGEIVKVLDFGIARFLPACEDDVTRVTSEGVLMGTPAYMSPEQLLGESPAVSWDLWALAVVAYETLSGATPFADSARDWRRAILSGSFTPLNAHLTVSHAGWQTFFESCFAIDRSKRPGSVAEFFRRAKETFG